MMESSSGARAIPNYEILQRIGEGGMGEVFLANQLSLNRQVVVKFLKAKSASEVAELKLRFDREASLMAEVSHPHIVTVFDRGTVDGQPYLVTEYVEGENLRQRLQPGAPMPVKQARPILRSIAQAVGFLHERGILHRDLKPENVLLGQQGHVKVADFGLAVSTTDIGSVTQSGQFVGTIDYMAPEQRHRLGIDERADQFSLAVIAYELLTGHKPLGIFKRPSEKNPLLTPEVDAVILRALQDDPDDRHPSVQIFGETLDRALSGVQEPRFRRWPLVFTAVIAIAIMAGGLVWFRTGPAPPKISSPAGWRKDASRELDAQKEPAPAQVVTPPFAAAPFSADEAGQHQQRWANYLKVPVVEANSIGMQMVLIPPGKFSMGSTQAEVARLLNLQEERNWSDLWDSRFRSEAPQHKVKITKPFHLGATEVTLGHFRTFVDATDYKTDEETGGVPSGSIRGQWISKPEFGWSNLGDVKPSEDCPVTNVSYSDATAFCKWLSEKEKETYRLPSEVEWEYACRAGSTTRWCFGVQPWLLDSFAWYESNSGATMHPVSQKRPNGFGLFDVHGNVWEWCSDWYGTNYYGSARPEDPTGPSFGRSRVLRSGAFYNPLSRLRSACRHWDPPTYRRHYIGFRVARTVRQALPLPATEIGGEQKSASHGLPRSNRLSELQQAEKSVWEVR